MRLSDLQEEVTNLFKNYSLTDLPEDIRNMAYLWFAISHRSTLEGDQEKLNIMIARLKQNGYTARVDYDTDEVIVTKGRERYTDPVEEVMIRLMSMAMKQDNSDIDEGMGGSTGGGTAGSAGAGGSSLGLPYPSTYEEEYDKFKNFHPINKNKRPMHNLSLTTEEAVDKVWLRDELPQLNITDFEGTEYTTEKINVSISKVKPVQTERVKGLVKKTIKMLKSGKEKPIVVDKHGYIVNGHHRYDAYKKLNYKTIPAIKVNATIEELIDKYM